jgi:ribosomal protein S12 methylthiotransferase accessory factor
MPMAARFGISRVADITGLDILGIPVCVAVRPLARTLSVAQGKGASTSAAKVSAVMEAIELWHAEHAVPPAVVRATAAAELQLPYCIAELADPVAGIATPSMLLDWIPAASFTGDTATYIPREAVHMNWCVSADWQARAIPSTSNGLASGNSRGEACSHAILEVIERDCTSALSQQPVSDRTYLDPTTVSDQTCAELIGMLQNADAWFELIVAPSRWLAWCFACYVWLPDMGAIAAGAGAHTDPGIALSRAITEAAQSRLTTIVGTRDDITPLAYRTTVTAFPEPKSANRERHRSWDEIITEKRVQQFNDDVAEATWLAQQIADTSGVEPMIVDLTTSPAFSVVKVLCPGLNFSTRHQIPRPYEE